MTTTQKKKLKKVLVELIETHWSKYEKAKLKKDFFSNKENCWVSKGQDPLDILLFGLGRSYDSSLGTLYGNIVIKTAEFFNTKTYVKLKDLKITETGKEWIVDLAIDRDDTTYLIELKLGANLDNKKSKIESSALNVRKETLLENKLATNVETFLGIITLNNGDSSPETWKMGAVKEGFTRNEILVESELFNFISNNDTDLFDFLKTEIQPVSMKEWTRVRNNILNTYSAFTNK